MSDVPHPAFVSAETTPNPNTLKFNINRTLVENGSVSFTDPAQAKGVRLAERLFQIENIVGIMAGRNFITVTKAPSSTWAGLADKVSEVLKGLLESEEPLLPADVAGSPAGVAGAGGAPGDAGDIERRIMEILDSEIRPAVNMDGGDILFHGYKDGVVTLHLQGSCSHCPSSIMTLKMGVENRLKQLVPEIKEVVQV